MIYNWYRTFLFIFFCAVTFAQNNQILYNFDQLPQTLLLNPGAEVNYDKHVGVPFLSNIFIQGGAKNKNFTYNNIYTGTGDLSDLLLNIYNQDSDNGDYFMINQRLEILNAGFRLKNPKYYVSFGMYQEAQGFSLYPKDVEQLYYNGDDQNKDGLPELGAPYNFNNINFQGELLGVFHVGISKEISQKFTLGARLKLLSGSLNINSIDNSGNYDLSASNTTFQHNFTNMNVAFNSSGLIDEDGRDVIGGFSENFAGLFFAKENIGFGLDLGTTIHISDKITVTASLLDLDFINYKNETVSYTLKNDFVLNDVEFFNPPAGEEKEYWENTVDSYYDNGFIPLDTLQTTYNVNRSPKFNTSVSYKFSFKKSADKYVFRNVRSTAYQSKEVFTSEVGLQTFTMFRPDKVFLSVTGYYAMQVNRFLTTKITYTYDEFSAKNFGLGISTHINRFNFYATADNLLDLPKYKDSNYQSLQLGMNFMFD